MPETKTGPDRKPATDAVDLSEIARVNQQSLARMLHLNQQMIRDGLRFQAELLDFARRRLGAEIETQERLSRCHTMDDAARVVNEFCSKAMKDYSEEAAGLVKLGLTIATDAAQNAAETAQGTATGPSRPGTK